MQSSKYNLEYNRMGHYLLVRLCDLADCYFQAESDTQIWDEHLKNIEKANCSDYDKQKLFDCLCHSYDDILTSQGDPIYK